MDHILLNQSELNKDALTSEDLKAVLKIGIHEGACAINIHFQRSISKMLTSLSPEEIKTELKWLLEFAKKLETDALIEHLNSVASGDIMCSIRK